MTAQMLWHSTSSTIGELILRQGIRPSGTKSLSQIKHHRGTKPVDPSLIYLTDSPAHALPFGWVRVCGKIKNGRLRCTRMRKGSVALFGIDAEALHPELLSQGGLTGMPCEHTYRGAIPASALRHMICFPMSKELEALANAALRGEALRPYVGIDLIAHLRGKQFDIEEE